MIRRFCSSVVRTGAVVLFVCAGGTVPCAADWRRIDSPNFVVIGDVGARDLRDIAVKFEGFRETLTRVLAENVTATPVPTVVIVFPSDRAFTPFKPVFNGKPVEATGLFVAGPDVNYIALVNDGRPGRLRVVFHEYAHLLVSNVMQTIPVWLNEGLAEYYSSYEVTSGGREAMLGRALGDHLQRLNETQLLPLEELLKVDHNSSLYNEGDRRSVFYAQSWALTHLILLGEPNRTQQLGVYLRKLAEGVPATQAWQQAFGADRMDRELQRYIGRRLFRAYRYRFSDKLATFDAPTTSLSAANAEAFLSSFLIQQRRLDEASARLAKAAAAGETPWTSAAMALLEITRGEYASADKRLLSLGATDDWLLAYVAATAIADLVQERGDSPAPEETQAAQRQFEATQKLRGDVANAVARWSALQLHGSAAPSKELLAAIVRARIVAPGRADYAFLHAEILARQSDFPAARNVVGPLLSGVYPEHVRIAARRVMEYILQLEKGNRAAVPAAATADPSSSEGGTRDRTRSAAVRPIFRKLGAGEQRLEGLLVRIECSTSGAVFHLQTADGPVRVTAPRMQDVDFITYRDDLTGSVNCGALDDPLRVYVTWKPAAEEGSKIVVAIEFLPKQEP